MVYVIVVHQLGYQSSAELFWTKLLLHGFLVLLPAELTCEFKYCIVKTLVLKNLANLANGSQF